MKLTTTRSAVMGRLAAAVASFVLLGLTSGSAAEIGFIEDFSLAEDRTEALRQLIPGSQEYYYYHCLHYQNTEQFDQVEKLLKAWIKRYNDTPAVREIQTRQALLTYDRAPEASLEFIRQQLGIEFNHQRDAVGEKPNLPTALDQQLLSRERLAQVARQQHDNLAGFEDSALDWLVATELEPDRRRQLLQRLSRPDHANLARLIAADLSHRDSKPFGSMKIHHQLLKRQLDELLQHMPELLNQQAFVSAYLAKLLPGDDVNRDFEIDEYESYLDRLWQFVSRLAPVHNSLKAHVLYHRLLHDRSLGIYDKDRFMAYIKLPRDVPYIEPEFLKLGENRRFTADLNANFKGVTHLNSVGNDEPLVRSCLHRFFVNEASSKPYEPYLSDVYLRENLAETKIVNGLGEPEQWYSLLPPSKYQALKDRIDLDFAHTNKRYFGADDPVNIDLDVKNVPSLIVRVFEINTRNFYRENGRDVNTTINLDGLVANNSQTYKYDEPPLRRVRRHFEFRALTKPGVYVIDFIGNGMNSRVVIRKGRLRHLVRTGPVGHVFTILDEKNEKLSEATIWMAGREYTAGENGEIVVPFSTNPTRQAFIIEHNGLRTLAHFQHQAETYQLKAGIYVDRESLLKHATSPVIVRGGLYLNGTPVSLSDLEDVRLTITSVDHEGVSSTKEVKDFKLFEDRESVYEFQTPARLSRLSFRLQARKRSLSENKKIDLTVSESITLNQIDKTEKVEALHLAKVNGAYVLDLRGKTGETKPDRAVHLSIKHRDFTAPIAASLQTDRSGRIRLGSLHDITKVTATSPEGASLTWSLSSDRHTYYRTVHAAVGQPIEVPYTGSAGKASREELSLIELRGGTFVADRFSAISIRDGLVRVEGLPRGDYDLLLKRPGVRIKLRVTDGDEFSTSGIAQRQPGSQFLDANALDLDSVRGGGSGYVLGARQLELRGTKPLRIASMTANKEHVQIRLANHDAFSRVHLFATRQQPEQQAFAKLSRVTDAEPFLVPVARRTSLYVSGRSIGDEYQYIIDRRSATKFPGVMVERPSMLLNPWAIRDTEAGNQEAKKESEFAAAAEPQAVEMSQAAGARAGNAQAAGFANLDFLGEASAVLVNLRPNEQGVITVPIKALGAHQHLHAVAINPTHTAYRTLSLPEKPMSLIDLRLAAGLDPQEHFTQQQKITVVGKGEEFVVADLGSSRLEMYDTLARVYGLYATLSGDAKLAEFSFVLRWPDLGLDEKQTLYSKYACHELNFFLQSKDPDFFEQIVLPYLANKRDKTFLDDWLLGNRLGSYLRPWDYARLNTIERILLSQRIARDRQHTLRDVRDRVALLPLDIDRRNKLFSTALQGRALDASRRGRGFAGFEVPAWGLSANGGNAAGVVSVAGKSISENEPAPPEAVELQSNDFGANTWRSAPGDSRRSLLLLRGSKKDQHQVERLLDREFGDSYYESVRGQVEKARQLYQKLDRTQEWAESDYYKLLIEQQNADLVGVSSFWRDYAEHNPAEPFFSPNFAEAAGNFTEMMFALSLLDLPFEPGQHESKIAENTLTVKAGAPMIVFHEEVRQAGDIVEQTPILVSQNFFRRGDRYRQHGNQRLDKFVTDEFLVHTVYGCQIVITNPTSSPWKLDVLRQIPAGAIPVLSGQQTRSVTIDLKPYSTQAVEYHFYFPASGNYPHYPVHVAKDEQLLAHAEPVSLNVVEKLSRADRDSWLYISQRGSSEDVLRYLRRRNLHQTDLSKIAFRMGNKDFFLKVIELLTQRHAYNHTLWSYGVKHDVVPAVRQYLQHADSFVAQCGVSIDSPLLSINPVARRMYQHLDYRPLVNARVHRLGRTRKILNARLHGQYHKLLKLLSYTRSLSDDDRLAITYYLLLQDRIGEAIAFFDEVNPGNVETSLQYDYFAAYLSLYRADVATARQIAGRYATHPVERWRNAFVAIGRQISEIDSGDSEVIDKESRGQRQAELASTEPSFEMKVEAKKVHLEYQNLGRATVNYYLMDIELLFSRNPFVQGDSNQFSQILPNFSDTIPLLGNERSVEFPLPDELQNRNLLVEVVGAGQAKSQAYYSNSLSAQVIENYGRLRVTAQESGQPLSKVYVKVYARMKDGSVRFYKDGYTDLRGRFDYSSLNTNELDSVTKFALLILSDQHGATVREAIPPKR